MKIAEAVLSTEIFGLRVSTANRWLVGNADGDGWIVYEKAFGARRTTRIIDTQDEDAAVAALLGGDAVEVHREAFEIPDAGRTCRRLTCWCDHSL